MFWRQRCCENWLRWGDRNTKWFHKQSTIRRNRNVIKGIFNEGNRWREDPLKIDNTFLSYFTNMFPSSSPSEFNINKVLRYINAKVTSEMNSKLSTVYTREEIFQPLNQMHPSKASSLDGFPALFYQQYWHVIGEQTINRVLDFLNNFEPIDVLNHTNIVLIPKCKHPMHVSGFFPINLCNVSYKIISKVLVNCLKPILDSIISQKSKPINFHL